MTFQEDVIADLTGFALGSRFLFFPDDYRKGRGSREPADLAWYCRDIVVLMYMTETARGWQCDAEHNMRQAQGWMRAWQDGRPLTGSNGAQQFAVTNEDALAKVILSISADAALEVIADHSTQAVDGNIDLCATVSERLVRLLAKRGGGVSDLVALLVGWPQVKEQVPSLTDIQWFESFRSLSVDKAAREVGWRAPDVFSSDLDLATRYVRGIRAVPAQGKPDAASDVNALFADFSFAEQFQLLFTIGRAAELVRAGTPMVRLPFRIDRYRGSVVVVENSSLLPRVAQSTPDGDFEYLFELQMGLTAVAMKGIRSPSRAWQTLRK